MSIQDIILSSLSNLQTDDGDIRGVLNHILNIQKGGWVPFIDIIDNTEMYIINVELPGDHDDMKVDFSNNKVTIHGTKHNKHLNMSTGNTDIIIKNEISYGRYSRVVIIPFHIKNKKDVTIEYENGVLSIKIIKKYDKSSNFVINVGSTRIF